MTSADSAPTMLPPTVSTRTTPSGLEVLTVANAHGTAEVYLQGAHVTSWVPAGQDPVLWLSSASAFEPGLPIRGGIPLCFPWFGPRAGDPDAPPHGYARRSVWTLVDAYEQHDATSDGQRGSRSSGPRDSDEGAATVLRLALGAPDDAGLAEFAGLEAVYEVTVGRTLEVALTVTATGEAPVRFEEAQHTYLRVRDVETTAVHGLDDVGFFDKAAPQGTDPHKAPEGAPVVPSGQVDRVYQGTAGPLRVVDGVRTIVVTKTSSQSTVVWSPGAELAARTADMGEGEWRQMICVETCNVGEHAVVLQPGESHTLASSYEVVLES